MSLFDLVSLRNVVDILQVSESTVRRWVKQKRIPSVKVGGQWRFPARLIRDIWFDDPNKANRLWESRSNDTRRGSGTPTPVSVFDDDTDSAVADEPTIALEFPVAAHMLTKAKRNRD